MVHYKKYKTLDESLGKGKWYGRAVPLETVDLDGLAKHMANHNTPYSEGCIRGVLRDMADCIKELLLDGKNVKLNELAIFSVSLQTIGAETAAEFTAARNIKGVRLNARATGSFTSIKTEITYKELTEYNKDGEQAGGSTDGGDDTSTGGGSTDGATTNPGGSDTQTGGGSGSGGYDD
jgi:predicted histone-like DNA-binding protein